MSEERDAKDLLGIAEVELHDIASGCGYLERALCAIVIVRCGTRIYSRCTDSSHVKFDFES